MGKAQRDKGARFEREIVNRAKLHELDAQRVPLSGATNFAKGDVVVTAASGVKWIFEAKKRGDGFKQIYAWLEAEAADALVIGADNKPPLVVLPMADFFDLLAGRHG